MKNLDQVTDDICCMLSDNKSEYQSLLASGTWTARDEAESIYDADEHDFTIEQLEESIGRLFEQFESESNPSQTQISNMTGIEITLASENPLTASQKRSALAKARVELAKKGYCAGVAFVYADGTIAITTWPAMTITSFVAHKFQKIQGKWQPVVAAPNWEKYFDFRHLIQA